MPLKKLRIKLRYAKSVVYEEKKTIGKLYNILWLLQIPNLQIVALFGCAFLIPVFSGTKNAIGRSQPSIEPSLGAVVDRRFDFTLSNFELLIEDVRGWSMTESRQAGLWDLCKLDGFL